VKETLRTRGLRDDTTCLVVDLVPPSNSQHAAPPVKKKKSSLQRILFWRRKETHLSGALSGVPVMEQLFEEGSAMLADRLGTVSYPDGRNGLFLLLQNCCGCNMPF
jgi:hypothetical protein